MSSPWEPAIPQAMQRHGGSNWSLPKAQPKPLPSEAPHDCAVAKTPAPDDGHVSVMPERSAG